MKYEDTHTSRTTNDDVLLATPELMRLIRCSCDSQEPCSKVWCGCTSVNMYNACIVHVKEAKLVHDEANDHTNIFNWAI